MVSCMELTTLISSILFLCPMKEECQWSMDLIHFEKNITHFNVMELTVLIPSRKYKS